MDASAAVEGRVSIVVESARHCASNRGARTIAERGERGLFAVVHARGRIVHQQQRVIVRRNRIQAARGLRRARVVFHNRVGRIEWIGAVSATRQHVHAITCFVFLSERVVIVRRRRHAASHWSQSDVVLELSPPCRCVDAGTIVKARARVERGVCHRHAPSVDAAVVAIDHR